MATDFTVIDHSDEVLADIDLRIEAALTSIGINCQSYMEQNIAKGVPRHPGQNWYRVNGASGLVGSIGRKMMPSKKEIQVGSDSDHAIFNEYGTGTYAEGGKGRKGWWVYVLGGTEEKSKNTHKVYTEQEARKIVAIMRSKGLDAHMTQGMTPLHFVKNAVVDNIEEYKDIITSTLKK